MTPLAYKDQISDKLKSLITYRPEDTNVYFIGSSSASRQATFNQKLSDVDLLFVLKCDSLDDYRANFEQATNIIADLERSNGQLVEAFILSSRIVDVHFSCLSVIAGNSGIQDEDLIFGTGQRNENEVSTAITVKCRKNLYVAKATIFCREYQQLLPVADTSKARQTAKLLLRGFKLIICANTEPNKLKSVEQKLFLVDTFDKLKPLLVDTTTADVTIDDAISKALFGETVDDWPAWMIAQDTVARQLSGLEGEKLFNVTDYRLYDSLCQAYSMLMIDVKNIISERSEQTRVQLIDEYANTTASIVVKLGLAGVEGLVDFESTNTPKLISESYSILVDHLKTDKQDPRCLAASVILLEYAFEQGILTASDAVSLGR